MVRPRARIAALVALALTLACVAAVVVLARDGTAPASERARDGRVTLIMRDFRYSPQVIRAAPGRLTIELRNDGRLGHAFHVRRDGRLWIEERRLLPGERRTVRVRLPRGDYRTFDPLSNFEELGMYGTLSIR